MDSVLLVLSTFLVSGAIGVALAWGVTSLFFLLLLRRPVNASPATADLSNSIN
jgi:hypothetical protein